MSSIFPFPGWRYDPGKVDLAKVMAPPYDIIGPEEQESLYARDDRNVVRLIFGRQGENDSPHDNRYTRAASHLDAWRGDMLFLQDRPAVYLYEQEFENSGVKYVRRGFFARVRLSEWGKEGIYPHEKTLSGPKQDRLELMRSTRGNLEPIFGLLADPENEVAEALANLVDYEPCLDIRDDDNVRNRMWVVDDQDLLHRLLSLTPEPEIFIADGHHRYETALAYQEEIRAKMQEAGQVPPLRGDLDCDYIMMFIVPDSDPGLVIWPTHRIVYGLENFDPVKFLRACEKNFTVAPIARERLEAELDACAMPCFGFAYGDKLFILLLKHRAAMDAAHPDAAEAWKVLDVSVLHTLIMDELLGIDEGKLLRKENIVYSKSLDETLDWVRTGRDGAQCGFILRSTPMQQVRDIAEAGAVMPQKSTYFYPKPLSGLVFHLFW
ncbi:MAG: DUF1015 domain-containing protein [Planctomycetaceae bacterium]|nr:DUF1015 domain-containing protein [Planctomycetaceae bacterium]